jgi:two-component system, OmpR family, response regulator
MPRILLVEDEVRLASTVGRRLTDQGFEVRLAHDGYEGLRLAKEPQVNLVVLDIMLPGISGTEVCRRLRAEDVGTPVLVLTARDADADETDALDNGADDYLRKPFSLAVLVARCNALLRRGGREGWSELVVGDLVLDPGRRVARRGHQQICLSRREAALLEYLMRSRGRVRSREEILEHVWGDVENRATNVVDVYLGYLRKKLDQPFGTASLRTVRGRGYRLESSP